MKMRKGWIIEVQNITRNKEVVYFTDHELATTPLGKFISKYERRNVISKRRVLILK